jgi:polysaccharide pyruvyl transferase WcaK-like protein
VLAGYFGTGNLGNDGSLSAMINILSDRRRFELVCITHAPDRARQLFKAEALPFHAPGRVRGRSLPARLLGRVSDLLWTFHYVRQVDAVVVPGTGALSDEEPGSVSSFLAVIAVAAAVLRRPMFLVSIGAEPPLSAAGRRRSRFVVRHSTYCSTRDAYSARVLREVTSGRVGTPRVCPDLVFSSPISTGPAPEGKVLGLGVLNYRGIQPDADLAGPIHKRYFDELGGFTVRLIEQGWKIRLLGGSAVDTDCAQYFQEFLHRRLNGLNYGVVRLTDHVRMEDVEREVADCRVVISSRFHNLIAALRAGRPVISLGYEPKHDNLMHDFGLDRFCQDIQRLDIAKLEAQFSALLENEGAIIRDIRERRDELIQRAADQRDFLVEELGRAGQVRYRKGHYGSRLLGRIRYAR